MIYPTPLQVLPLYSCSIFHDVIGEFDDNALYILRGSPYVQAINEYGYLSDALCVSK